MPRIARKGFFCVWLIPWSITRNACRVLFIMLVDPATKWSQSESVAGFDSPNHLDISYRLRACSAIPRFICRKKLSSISRWKRGIPSSPLPSWDGGQLFQQTYVFGAYECLRQFIYNIWTVVSTRMHQNVTFGKYAAPHSRHVKSGYSSWISHLPWPDPKLFSHDFLRRRIRLIHWYHTNILPCLR